MPSFLYNSTVRAVSDHCNLILQIAHRIDLGRPSDAPRHLSSASLLKPADIVLASDLVITLSGSFAGAKMTAQDIYQSHLAKHLVEYLRMNATQLGLSYVSGVIHDQGDERPKVIVRPTCLNPLQLQHMPTCATLTSLDLAYTWQIPLQQRDSKFPPLADPFAQTLALPYLTLLDDVVKRFVKWHLVKRYPLIFGSWRRQLEIESAFCLSIYRSIRSIVDRSDNRIFKEKCQEKLMAVKEKLVNMTANAAASLYGGVPDQHGDSANLCLRTPMGEEETLCLAMERLFQAGLQPSKFQISTMSDSDPIEDEQLSQSLVPCLADDSQQQNHKNLWESPLGSPLQNNLMDSSPSYVQFPLGLCDQHLFIVHSTPTPDRGSSELDGCLDDISSSQTTEPSVLLPFVNLNRTAGTVNSMTGKGFFQEAGYSGTPSGAADTQSHLMQTSDFDEDLLSSDMTYYRLNNALMNDRYGPSEKLISTIEDDFQQGPLDHHQDSANLFDKGSNCGGFDSLDFHDYNWGDDVVVSHAIPESTVGMPSSMLLKGDPQEATAHVPGSILSEPHLTYHASDISTSTCSRTDQKKGHDLPVDGASAQFNTPWDDSTGWKPNSEVLLEFDADWEHEEHFLSLIDE